MKSSSVVSITTVLALTGCTTMWPATWPEVNVAPQHKQPAEQVLRDRGECWTLAEKEAGHDPDVMLESVIVTRAMFDAHREYVRAYADCMIGRGYEVVQREVDVK